MGHQVLLGVAIVSLTGVALLASPAVSQKGSTTVARYTVDAGTTSGFAGMGGGGGGLGAAMSMMRGGGGQVAHELTLRLGSTRAATGAPKADHFMPPAAQLGASVPLLSPERPVGREPVGPIPQGQMPRGRLLLFWGCGEHAPAGQPVVVDFAKLAKGQVPPNLFARGVNLPEDWQILTSNSATYGEWPNGRDSKVVKSSASLLGVHRVVSTFAPDINFTLADDFMPALQARSASLPSGATRLDWNAVARATGYYAWAMGAKNGGGDSPDMVWWSSSSTQQFGGELAGWLSPAAVGKLVAAKTVMPPSQTSCAIPAEVKAAGGAMMMTQLYGYGPQANFSYPPRPANAASTWRPEWIARVRFRSNTSLMLGMPSLNGMGAAEGSGEASQPAPAAKPKCKGLKGIAMRAAGLCE